MTDDHRLMIFVIVVILAAADKGRRIYQVGMPKDDVGVALLRPLSGPPPMRVSFVVTPSVWVLSM